MSPVSNPLKDLRDIHLPPPISHWPPAPGWFFLAGLILAVAGYVSYRLLKHWHQTRAKRFALKQLIHLEERYHNQGSVQIITEELSILVRRTALAAFPRKEVASLEGNAWLQFLDKTGNTNLFSSGPGRILSTAPYQRKINPDIKSVFDVVKHWIETSI